MNKNCGKHIGRIIDSLPAKFLNRVGRLFVMAEQESYHLKLVLLRPVAGHFQSRTWYTMRNVTKWMTN